VKPLGVVNATAEQLTVIEDGSPGYWLIRGAAGSGKTTTALLRLRFLVRLWRERAKELGTQPVRVLVLTFNRSLKGYIENLTSQQVALGADVFLEVETFAHWAISMVNSEVIDHGERETKIRELAAGTFEWEPRFLMGETDYVLGRFLPDDLDQYLDVTRSGRGRSPQVTRTTRARFLEGVIRPFIAWKDENDLRDWGDLAVELALEQIGPSYDIVVVDEAQDFSANQIRAIVNHLAENARAHARIPTSAYENSPGLAAPVA
jgi:AAA domain